MSFMEKLKNVNKKNVAIVAAIIFVLAVVIACGVEYSQMQKAKSEISSVEEGLPDLGGAPTKENAEQQKPQAEPTKKPSEYKIGIPYEKAIKGDKPILTLFYADWCHYCIKFMPTYQALSKIYKDDFNFSKVNVEDPKYEKVVNEVGIGGFPTVYIIDPKYDNRVLLSNSIFGNMKTFRVELDRFLRIRKMLDKKD